MEKGGVQVLPSITEGHWLRRESGTWTVVNADTEECVTLLGRA